MTVFVSAHRKVIAYIHLGYQSHPFAIWEIKEGTKLSTASVARTVRQLVNIRLLRHRGKSYRNRNYEVTKAWDKDVMKNIDSYEYAKALNL